MLRNVIAFMRKHKAIIVYLFFGGLTTIVNFIVYYPLFNFLNISAAVSNAIAWSVAVIFAYLTNKPFVFGSHDWSLKKVAPEFAKFVGSRVVSGGIETLLVYLLVDLLHWNGNIWKIVISVLVVILNYIGSKFLVFKK